MTDITTALNDDNNAVTALTTVVTDVVTALQALETEVASLQAGSDPAAFEQVATNINTLASQLTAALPAPSAPPA